MKRPLTTVALIYVAGVLGANWLPLPLGWLLLCSLFLAWLTLRSESHRTGLLACFVFLLGWTNLAWHTAIISPRDLRVLLGDRIELTTLRARLLESPTQRVLIRDDAEIWRSLVRVEALALFHKTNWEPAFGQVLVSTPGLLPATFFAGQTVDIIGVLQPPKGPVAEGLFDYRAYLRWQGIHYQLQTQSSNDWQFAAIGKGNAMRWSDRFQSWAKQTLARGLPAEDEDLRLLWAMTLGWQTALTSEVSEPFMRSGTMHIFAISGLHIALIAGILVQLLRLIQVPRGVCGIVVIPIIWFYTAATGWQASAIRSTIMMTVVIAGWALKRPGDLLNSLSAAGFIILLWEPRQIFQASFQLSFFVVLSIALLLPPFEKIRQRLLKSDPLLPEQLRPRWKRWLDTPVRAVTTSFATSLAACLGSLPLIAYYFHLITPISLLANLVIVPLSSLALMCNLGSLVCGDWLPSCAGLFNYSAWLWMHWMIRLSEWSVMLPGAFWYIRSPTTIEFMLYYGLLVAALTSWAFSFRYRIWVALVLAALGVIWVADFLRERHRSYLTILPLGSGHAVYSAATSHNSDLLVDCGNESATDYVLKPFLRSRGVNHLDNFLLTHGDSRYIGGAELVLKNFPPRQALTSSVRQRSHAYRQITGRLAATPGKRCPINRGDSIGAWKVLHPDGSDNFSQADDAAVILRAEIHGARVLLFSDLGKAGQAALLARDLDLSADIVVAGMPNHGEPLGDPVLAAIRPKVIILCSTDYPATKRPGKKLRERLERRGVPIIYTHASGAVTFTFGPRGWDLRTMNGVHLRGQRETNPQGK
jgi:competence protein ComEC